MALSARERRAVRLRRVIAAVALLGQLAATFGLPLPASAKDKSSPYPCMNHACGCRSAEECWRGCCCFTNAEKVAWADANGVEIPEFVRTAAAREQAAKPKCCKCAKCAEEKQPAEQPAVTWVLGFAAMRCHAHGPAALFQATPAVPVTITPNRAASPAPAETIAAFDISPISIGTIPADPPPRV